MIARPSAILFPPVIDAAPAAPASRASRAALWLALLMGVAPAAITSAFDQAPVAAPPVAAPPVADPADADSMPAEPADAPSSPTPEVAYEMALASLDDLRALIGRVPLPIALQVLDPSRPFGPLLGDQFDSARPVGIYMISDVDPAEAILIVLPVRSMEAVRQSWPDSIELLEGQPGVYRHGPMILTLAEDRLLMGPAQASHDALDRTIFHAARLGDGVLASLRYRPRIAPPEQRAQFRAAMAAGASTNPWIEPFAAWFFGLGEVAVEVSVQGDGIVARTQVTPNGAVGTVAPSGLRRPRLPTDCAVRLDALDLASAAGPVLSDLEAIDPCLYAVDAQRHAEGRAALGLMQRLVAGRAVSLALARRDTEWVLFGIQQHAQPVDLDAWCNELLDLVRPATEIAGAPVLDLAPHPTLGAEDGARRIRLLAHGFVEGVLDLRARGAHLHFTLSMLAGEHLAEIPPAAPDDPPFPDRFHLQVDGARFLDTLAVFPELPLYDLSEDHRRSLCPDGTSMSLRGFSDAQAHVLELRAPFAAIHAIVDLLAMDWTPAQSTRARAIAISLAARRQRFPDDADLAVRHAEALQDAGRSEEASVLLASRLADVPHHADALHALARCWTAMGATEAVLALVQSALDGPPEDTDGALDGPSAPSESGSAHAVPRDLVKPAGADLVGTSSDAPDDLEDAASAGPDGPDPDLFARAATAALDAPLGRARLEALRAELLLVLDRPTEARRALGAVRALRSGRVPRSALVQTSITALFVELQLARAAQDETAQADLTEQLSAIAASDETHWPCILLAAHRGRLDSAQVLERARAVGPSVVAEAAALLGLAARVEGHESEARAHFTEALRAARPHEFWHVFARGELERLGVALWANGLDLAFDHDLVEVAKHLAELIEQRSAEELNAWFDLDRFLARCGAGLSHDEDLLRGLTEGLRKGFSAPAKAFGAQLAFPEGVEVRLIDLLWQDATPLARYRVSGGDNFWYLDLRLARNEAGEVRVEDYSFQGLAGPQSSLIRDGARNHLGGTPEHRHLVDSELHVELFRIQQRIQQHVAAGDPEAALDAWHTLPIEGRALPALLLLRCELAAQVDAAQAENVHPDAPPLPSRREEALRALERGFGHTLAPALRRLASSPLLETRLAALRRIGMQVDDENFTDVLQARLLTEAGRVADAVAMLEAVIARSPAFLGAHSQLVHTALQQRDHAATARALNRLVAQGYTFNDLTELELYAHFVQSEEYRQWLAGLPDEADEPAEAEESDDDSSHATGDSSDG